MKSTQLMLFTVAAAVTIAGCANRSNDPAPAPKVDESAFSGTPGEFAALYTGTCAIQTATRLFNNCSTRVRIRHKANEITINTQFLLNPSSRVADEHNLIGHDTLVLIQNGGQLLHPVTDEPIGIIGERGFQITRDGNPYRFARLYPNTYEYSGNFKIDGTGEMVGITGRLKRGGPVSDLAAAKSQHRARR